MDALPPRYRITERGRRLIVTDTWAARELPTRITSPPPLTPVSPLPSSRAPQPAKPVTDGDPFFAMVARLACLNAADAAGRPILSTIPAFDEQAPREFVLGEQGQRRLAISVLAAALALLALAATASDSWAFAVILPALAVLGIATKGRPLLTLWLDGFARLDGR